MNEEIKIFFFSAVEPYVHHFSELIKSWYRELSPADNFIYFYLIPCIVVFAYLFEAVRFYFKNRKLARGNGEIIALGKIRLGGEFSDIYTQEDVAMVLRHEFLRAGRCLEEMANDREKSYQAPSTEMDAGYCHIGLRQNAPIPEIRTIKDQIVEKNVTLKLGPVSIPVTDIINMLIAFAGLLPVPARNRYRESLIHVSLLEKNEVKTVIVYKPRGSKSGKQWRYSTLLKTIKTENLDDINSLLRDAAYMILSLNNSFGNKDWQGMRYLLDGFDAFSDYRKSGLQHHRNAARENFKAAVQRDPEHNSEALYYYGVMKMMDRTTEAIEEAMGYFIIALSSRNMRLQMFTHLALAFCYAQTHHRLGHRSTVTIQKAETQFKLALNVWNEKLKDKGACEKQTDKMQTFDKEEIPAHPLFLYTKSLILIVNDSEKPDRMQRLFDATRLLMKAIQQVPRNSMFYNNLGWIFLRMVEWGNVDIPEEERMRIPIEQNRDMNIPELAEKYFYKSLALNRENKLSHANLCRLFSADYYKNRNSNDYQYQKCRYHGLKAVALDRDYINGYRDLALAHIRYNKLKDAYRYYVKALQLAEDPYKDQEIVSRIINEIRTLNLSERPMIPVMQEWEKPDYSLFEPRSAVLQPLPGE